MAKHRRLDFRNILPMGVDCAGRAEGGGEGG